MTAARELRLKRESRAVDANDTADSATATDQTPASGQNDHRPNTGPPGLDGPAWPAPYGDALHGLVGEVVNTIAPQSEADPASILMQLLVTIGNVIGPAAHAMAERDVHACNLNTVIVGATANGRKGTSFGHVRNLLSRVDETWAKERIVPGGLSSGEGLVFAVRDPVVKEIDGETVEVDPGVSDKRLLAIESEFASVLKMIERSGNTLSVVIRQAWDSGTFRSLTKNSALAATGAHISIIGHITGDELKRCLTSTEAANGFANRFLWSVARRSQLLPDGGCPDEDSIDRLSRELAAVVKHARTIDHPLRRTDRARELWHEVYPRLSEGRAGLLGAVTGRAEAQVLRLSVLYAVIDRAEAVDTDHLRAALDVWRRCEQSAAWVFGNSLGDPIADELLGLLRGAGRVGVTRTGMRDHFGRNRTAGDIDRALGVLARANLAAKQMVATSGRAAETWFAATTKTTDTTKTAMAPASVASVVSVVAPTEPMPVQPEASVVSVVERPVRLPPARRRKAPVVEGGEP